LQVSVIGKGIESEVHQTFGWFGLNPPYNQQSFWKNWALLGTTFTFSWILL